ncbi:ArsR/SmtB family transcription factor [Limnoglobus roseus]|uniref:ArsR family transcriptional regulator n=1 Tax=Limnoglobus roseus TaxID=2598579 RepID=A0A5C1AIK3_9BACT|nr:metalloregulator ArsR/SmtB family transcription factor [Limnoglobus roseus]QEL19259.1 ArsR family transcriptional regulator [Limnoglobus roseus]
MTDYQNARSLAEQLTALGEPTRLRIVAAIASTGPAAGPAAVGVLAERLALPLMNTSHHLGVLKGAGILIDRREGRSVVYSFAPGVFVPSRKDDELGTLHFGEWRISIGRTAGE